MATIYVGADGAMLSADIPASAAVVFQGLILIFYLAAYTLVKFEFQRTSVRKQA